MVNLPELNVAFFSFLLHFVWEMLQVPFFANLPESDHWVGVVVCTKATLGDVLIALSAFWTAAWAARSRLWFLSSSRTAWVIYLGMGVLLTVTLEWLATGALQRWTYTSEMPVIPWTPIGLFPLLQWVVVPPLVIWIARRQIGPRPEV